jgi:hypothetical protein
VEDHYNFRPFILAPYSDDGVNLYSLVHMEWPAACLVPGDIDIPGAYYNSWVTTITQMKSTERGRVLALQRGRWQLRSDQAGVSLDGDARADQSIVSVWRRQLYRAPRALQSPQGGRLLLFDGQPYQRDFSVIDPSQGVYQAPITKEGLAVIRTTNFKSPNNWEAWNGSGWEPQAKNNWGT